MQKNCVFVIENNSYFLDKMIKNFWYKDQAPFDLYLVYEPKCGTDPNVLGDVCDQWNNPNFRRENILSIEDLITATLPYLQSQGLNNVGEEWFKIWKVRSKLIAPIYFKEVLGYEGAMLLDDDILIVGPIEEMFDGTWREHNYGLNSMKPLKLNDPEEYIVIKEKISNNKKQNGLIKWMHSFWQNEIYDDVWSNMEFNDWNSVLMNSGMNTYITAGFNHFVENTIKLANHVQLGDLYNFALTNHVNNKNKSNSLSCYNRSAVPSALWMIDEYFHQGHLHKMIINGYPVTIDQKRNEVIFARFDDEGKPILGRSTKLLLSKNIIHYVCGKHKKLFVDLIDQQLQNIGYNGNKSNDEVLEIIKKARNKINTRVPGVSKLSKYLDKFKHIAKVERLS